MLTSFDPHQTVIDRSAFSWPPVADRRLLTPMPPSGLAWHIKGVVERGGALILIIAILPLLAVAALAVALESGGPVLFRQPRFGRGGVAFDVLKFRTMQRALCDASGAGQTRDADPRITRVGHILRKTSLDELPQLWNVVTGQMALIGPRAHPCGMCVDGVLCEQLVAQYHTRHIVRPGITGWAQVNASRGAVKTAQALEQRVALDLTYITHWSLWLDARILWRTIRVVASCKQAQ